MVAIGDAKLVLAGGISGARRIGRHLWRMCLGITLAAGSAFTNGFPAPPPEYRASTANHLVCSSVVLARGADLPDGPRAVRGLYKDLAPNCTAHRATRTPLWRKSTEQGIRLFRSDLNGFN